jgi:4-amino-4-deoxy-L-arabinose transferase-like glycosyltransferase
VASFIYAVSPYAVFFDRMALADSMLSMFGIWALFLVIVTAKTLRLDFAMLAGFALGGALLTKSPALFFVILLPITWLLANWSSSKESRILKLLKAAGLLSVTYVIAYGMYNILRLGPNFHMIGLRNRDYVLPLSHILTNPKDPFIFHIDRALEWFWQLGPSILVIFTLLGIMIGFKRFKKETLILLAWSLLPVFVQSMYAKSFTTRYVLFSLPVLIVLAAMSFLINKEIFKRGLVLGLIVFVFHAFYINRLLLTDIKAAPLPRVMRSGYLEEWTAGTGIKEAAEIIREEYKNEPDKKIIVGTEGYFGTLPDGLQIYLNDLPEVTVIGVGIDFGEIPSQLLESAKAGNKTFFVVNSSRLKADPEKLGLKLIAAYPKAFRPDGIKEYVQFGPHDTLYLFEVSLLSKEGS